MEDFDYEIESTETEYAIERARERRLVAADEEIDAIFGIAA